LSTPKTQRTHNSSTKDQLEKIWIAPHVHLQWSCPDHNTPNIISRLIIYDPLRSKMDLGSAET